jgi:hypothetical protein
VTAAGSYRNDHSRLHQVDGLAEVVKAIKLGKAALYPWEWLPPDFGPLWMAASAQPMPGHEHVQYYLQLLELRPVSQVLSAGQLGRGRTRVIRVPRPARAR